MVKKDTLDKIIQSNRWVKNDIAMGRIQCSKVVRTNGEPELLAIITSNELKEPVAAYIEEVLVANNQLILFYDGQFLTSIGKDEYGEYKDYLSREEWEIVFSKKPSDELVNRGMIAEGQGYLLEIHESMEEFMRRGYSEELSNEIQQMYHL
ncbi:hypothetical protein [Clostridium cellulovorans]|uniref:Uncharacterized protein n=1 Tax=Clostridium cellulovorans (strain ATCC 35296 / DSM 3052 / OCM 3 / 743B) TaxID=573061 RepID=D9SST5_CLOC7|nr:hypothetical protein [Clostridium cellulovorans]ADL52597.1 hypothetical protein Clocel_2902 [Clostridium cellulovorans 743B]